MLAIPIDDLIGHKIGRWTVLGPGKPLHRNVTCHCRCACGRERDVRAGRLRSGDSRSCGRCGVPVEARFWPRVFVPRIGLLEGRLHLGAAVAQEKDSCWEWRGSRRSNGYGTFLYKGRTESAQRVAWVLYHGHKFPSGKAACHTCDNPPCVNPFHIWPGTAKENAQDAMAKGRLWTPLGRRGYSKTLSERTHCKYGHRFPGPKEHGRRVCRICARRRSMKYYFSHTAIIDEKRRIQRAALKARRPPRPSSDSGKQ